MSLINISLTLKNAMTLVEAANSEVIFESDDCILLDITFQNSEAYSKSH